MIREFDKPIDLDQVNSWLKERCARILTPSDIPAHGLIEDKIACGFLFRAESGICFLEGFVTNPAANAQDRNEALYKISMALVETAREWGMKRIMVLTSYSSLADRAKAIGFFPVASKVYSLDF